MKDTVLRRELASIALAIEARSRQETNNLTGDRKMKNFFRGMLSAFRSGVSVVVDFHNLAAWSYALFSLRGLE